MLKGIQGDAVPYADCPYPLNGDPKMLAPMEDRIQCSRRRQWKAKNRMYQGSSSTHCKLSSQGNSRHPSWPPGAHHHTPSTTLIAKPLLKEWRCDPTRPYADLWWEWWAAHKRKRDGAEALRKVKAHTTAAGIGIKMTETDMIGNDFADAIVKDAMKRFPADSVAQERFAKAE